MLKDEFRPIDGRVLTIGRSPKEKIYTIPKAVFDLPKKERELILWDCLIIKRELTECKL